MLIKVNSLVFQSGSLLEVASEAEYLDVRFVVSVFLPGTLRNLVVEVVGLGNREGMSAFFALMRPFLPDFQEHVFLAPMFLQPSFGTFANLFDGTSLSRLRFRLIRFFRTTELHVLFPSSRDGGLGFREHIGNLRMGFAVLDDVRYDDFVQWQFLLFALPDFLADLVLDENRLFRNHLFQERYFRLGWHYRLDRCGRYSSFAYLDGLAVIPIFAERCVVRGVDVVNVSIEGRDLVFRNEFYWEHF